MGEHRIFKMPFASIYSAYVNKVEKKGRTTGELDRVLCWMTGFSKAELDKRIESGIDLRGFFDTAPLNPDRTLITGVVCGVRVEEVEDPLMREIRYMDKLVDELARGKKIESVLRAP